MSSFLLATASAWAGGYVFTSIMPASVGQPTLGGLNAKGQAVGSYVDPTTYVQRGYFWSNGRFSPVDNGPCGTWLTDINDSGVAAGYYCASGQDQQKYKYTAFTYDTATGIATNGPASKKWSWQRCASMHRAPPSARCFPRARAAA